MTGKRAPIRIAKSSKGGQKQRPTKGGGRPITLPANPGKERSINEHYIRGNDTTRPEPTIKGTDTTAPDGSGKGNN